MPRTTSTDSFDSPSDELCKAIELLRHVVDLSNSLQAARDFREEIEFLRRREARLHLFDLIEVMDQVVSRIKNELIAARSHAGTAFYALNARDRSGMRIYHREDLKTYLDVRNADDPPNPSSQLFQAAQAVRWDAVEVQRKHLRERLRWFRDLMPSNVLDDPDIRERVEQHAAEADRMEVDHVNAGRELHHRFRDMMRDDQFLFLRWYETDLAANGIHWNSKKRVFHFVGVQTTLTASRSD